MRIAFIVNNVITEKTNYTTTYLAYQMYIREHQVYLIGIDDLACFPDGQAGGLASYVEPKKAKNQEVYLQQLQAEENKRIAVKSEDLDIIFLRNDPAEENMNRSWARIAGAVFTEIAINQGVIVVNDPASLLSASNKMYFQHFPESVRPKSLVSRDKEAIKNFFEENDQHIVVKPLQGSGGKNVFEVNKSNYKNLNQVVDAVNRDGYLLAQEYLPEAAKGDIRMLVMNGDPLQKDGKYAAFKRVSSDGDIRSNVNAGGEVKPAKVTDEMLRIVETVRPKLIQDGMFLVGLDIVGSKLMEINVFSPAGIQTISKMEETDFAEPLIESLERKVRMRHTYPHRITNKALAVI